MSTFRTQAKPEASHVSVAAWMGIVSTVVTVLLTTANAYWSRQIAATDQRLRDKAAELEEKKLDLQVREFGLSEGKERMARYTFVQSLFPSLLNDKDPGHRTLSINLINLALTPNEAERLFDGLKASSDKRAQQVGAEGSDLVALTELVAKVNAAARDLRVGAVEQLIKAHGSNPEAIRQALDLLEPPRLASLSPSGRINVLVFLKSTDRTAWTADQAARFGKAAAIIRQRHVDGVAEIGEQTQEALAAVEAHLKAMSLK